MSVIDVNKWRQGVLFSTPDILVVWNTIAYSDTGEPKILQKVRKPRPKEKFVLISQTCDVKAAKEDEPCIEALLCTCTDVSKEKNLNFLSRLDRNSARRFVVDFRAGLVAEAKYRVQIDKDILHILTSEPWPSTAERFGRFVRWLARRYDRPAIPDELVIAFQTPVETLLNQIDNDNPQIGSAFSRAVHEMRINFPESDQPPFNLQVLLMIKREEITAEEADAINFVFKTMQDYFNPSVINLDPNLLLRTDEEISLAEHRATRPLFLEYLTYQGEEVEGARPFERS